jgi:hypothetical protein
MAVQEEKLTLYTKRPFDPARALDLHLHLYPDCHCVGKEPFAVEVVRDPVRGVGYRAVLPNGCYSVHLLYVCYVCRKREFEEQGICPVRKPA